ncbi:hypothetical protein OROGR_023121 [Orobanche gracilis]
MFQLNDYQPNSPENIFISTSLESSPVLLDLKNLTESCIFSSKTKEKELNFDKSVKEVNLKSDMIMDSYKSPCSTNCLNYNVEKL